MGTTEQADINESGPDQGGPGPASGQPEVPEPRAGAAAEPADAEPSEPSEPAEPADATEPAEPAEPSEPAEPADAEPAGAEPDEPEQDPWAKFAPVPTRPPGRPRRIAMALADRLSHEWSLAVLGGIALAVVMTWPTLRYARTALPEDLGDPSLVTWLLAWSGHSLLTDPANLWHTNAFYPEGRWSLAFTDSFLGYAPFGLLGEGWSDAVLRYNLVFVFAYALAFIGAYALARQLGATPAAALVAAIAFAYAPWRIAHGGHLHVLSTGGIALALAMLARGHGWSLRRRSTEQLSRRRVSPGWIIAGWLVAAWQLTIGFGIGLAFGYVLGGVVAVVAITWLVRRVMRRPRQPVARVIGANLVGGAAFGAVAILMALPYLTVVQLYPYASRSLEEVTWFSPPLRGFLTAPANSLLWGSLHEGSRAAPVAGDRPFMAAEMSLLPGFTLIGLAVAGLFLSIWSVRTRLLLAGGVVVTVALAMGTTLLDGALYEPLYESLPGWDALRTPGRLILWTTLLLAILAAGAVSAFGPRAQELALSRGAPRPGPWLRFALLVPAALVLLEGVNTTPHVTVPPPPAALATVEGPILVLPSDTFTDMRVMLWTTDRFEPMVNGASGFSPPSQYEIRQVTAGFPTPESVDYLRSLGIATVVVLPDRIAGTPWERALHVDGGELGIVREDTDGAILFHLGVR